MTTRTEFLVKRNHYLLLHQPGKKLSSSCCCCCWNHQPVINKVAEDSLYEFSFSLWQGMVCCNLKDVVHKNSWAENNVTEGLFIKSIYFALWSWGPFLRIISRKAEMRLGLKHGFEDDSPRSRRIKGNFGKDSNVMTFTLGKVQCLMGRRNAWKQSALLRSWWEELRKSFARLDKNVPHLATFTG